MNKEIKSRQLKLFILFCIITIVFFIYRLYFLNMNVSSNISIYMINMIIFTCFIFVDFIIFIVLLHYFVRYDIKLIYKRIRYLRFKNLLSYIKYLQKGSIISICIIVIILLSIGSYYHNKAKKVDLNMKTVIFHIPFNNLNEDEKDKYLSIQANDYIRSKLKAPSTAVFSDPNISHEENVILGNEPNSYVIIGNVDSQNSFGVMIRSNFSVTIQVNGDKYNAVSNGYSYNILSYTFDDNTD